MYNITPDKVISPLHLVILHTNKQLYIFLCNFIRTTFEKLAETRGTKRQIWLRLWVTYSPGLSCLIGANILVCHPWSHYMYTLNRLTDFVIALIVANLVKKIWNITCISQAYNRTLFMCSFVCKTARKFCLWEIKDVAIIFCFVVCFVIIGTMAN